MQLYSSGKDWKERKEKVKLMLSITKENQRGRVRANKIARSLKNKPAKECC